MTSKAKLEELARELDAHPDFRVLRRLDPPDAYADKPRGKTRRALYVDCETTGLDTATAAVIELCMIPFDYDSSGRIVAVAKDEALVSLADPGVPIPPEVSALTGITDKMVRGKSIDAAEVQAAAESASLVIAHNAGFDRPIMERHWPVFADKDWACSLYDVDWKAAGIRHQALDAIAAHFGVFFDGHRADADCYAGIHVLAQQRPGKKDTFLAELLEKSAQSSYIVRAIGSPFEKKDLLKARGYRWHDGRTGHSKHWYASIDADALEAEKAFLVAEVYERKVEIPVERHSAGTRYSGRS